MSRADELSRYATMRDFPMFISVRPLTISKAGFFDIGNGTTKVDFDLINSGYSLIWS
jgi:hypothetical protein